MNGLEELFSPIAQEVEAQVKKYLKGLLSAGMIKPYLPQHWLFETEKETVTLCMNRNGDTSVAQGQKDPIDVIINIDHDFLSKALETRERPDFEPETFDVSFKTKKGETAFGYMKKHLGL